MNNNYSSEKEKKRPLVSIVTSTFNSEKTIRKTMESVLNQTYPRIEYIIADGDSHDNTLNIVGEYTELFREKGYTLQSSKALAKRSASTGLLIIKLWVILEVAIQNTPIYTVSFYF